MRNLTLDLLKIALATMVVGLHAQFLRDVNVLGYHLSTQGLFRIAVPTFFIINGYYFEKVTQNARVLEWFKRVAVLYSFWMLVYCFFWINFQGLTLRKIAVMLQQVLFGYYHLWYLPGIIGAALLLLIIRKRSTRLLVPAAIILMLVGMTVQYLGNYHQFVAPIFKKIGLMTWLYRNFAFFAFPFFCAGYLIREKSLESKVSAKYLWVAAILGLILLLGETYLNFRLLGSFISENPVSLILICPAIFLLAITNSIENNVKNLASYANGIYFVHPLILHFHDRIMHLGTISTTLFTILLALPVVFLLEFAARKYRFIL